MSAYHTFLGSLCFQMLGVEMPAIEDAIPAIAALNRPDGGYAELADQAASQTSATAAAVAFLVMHDALPPEKTAGTARFLAEMQSADGGLKPHAAVAAGDLLSTFTGLLTLSSLGGFDQIDAAARGAISATHGAPRAADFWPAKETTRRTSSTRTTASARLRCCESWPPPKHSSADGGVVGRR